MVYGKKMRRAFKRLRELLGYNDEAEMYERKLATAFDKLRDDIAFEVVLAHIADRCFVHTSCVVPGDPVQTYANEHLRELGLELIAMAEGEAFRPVKGANTEEDDDADA